MFGLGAGVGAPIGGWISDAFGWYVIEAREEERELRLDLFSFYGRTSVIAIVSRGSDEFLLDSTSYRRVAFLVQSPFLLFALYLLHLKIREPESFLVSSKLTSTREKMRRIDYLGSLTLVLAIGSLLVGMSLKTSSGASFSDVKVWGLLLMSYVAELVRP